MGRTIALVTNTGRFAWVNLRPGIDRLLEDGHRVVVLTDAGPIRERLTSLGVEVVEVPISRRIDPPADAAALVRLFRAFRRLRPDVVHTYTSKAGVLGRIAGRLAGVPAVVHTLQGLPFYEGQPRARYALYAALEWISGRFGHALFAENRGDAATARSMGLASRDRLHHIGSGIAAADLDRRLEAADREGARRAHGASGETGVILLPARLEAVKGHAFFLDVLDELRRTTTVPFVCWFAGDGPLRGPLEQRVKALCLDGCVRFLGFVDEMPTLLRAADILALPSEKEGIPRVVLEGMVARLPVVATDVLGTREVVANGITGLLAAFGDARSMAKHLAYLLERPAARRRMGRAGRERALRRFDDRKVAARMRSLYAGLLRGRGVIAPRSL